MDRNPIKLGVSYALISLLILAVMPVLSNSRPAAFGALSFAFFLSVWQLVFSIPFVLREIVAGKPGIFAAGLASSTKRRAVIIILVTGAIFGLSTFVYVFAVAKAGTVSAAIAMQAYPLFAILWETLFLKRRKSAWELFLTAVLIVSLYFLATNGSWRVSGFSHWFLVALGVPFLWSVAHVVIKEVLNRTPISPAQVTFFRALVSTVFLGVLLSVIAGPGSIGADLANLEFQVFAMAMGLVYYLELIAWFYAVRYIDVSLASSVTVPYPALTMVLAMVFLGETVRQEQIIAFLLIAASMYGLILASARNSARRNGRPVLDRPRDS